MLHESIINSLFTLIRWCLVKVHCIVTNISHLIKRTLHYKLYNNIILDYWLQTFAVKPIKT